MSVRRRVGLLVTAALALGCHLELVRWEAQGRHEDVVRAAEHARRPPRRQAARAWADALVALGRVEQARDVLLRDFRRGGQLTSLVELADLERSHGLDGMAAVHYTRVVTIDRTWLRGNQPVCALLLRRAHAWVGIGQGDAALDDLERVHMLCESDDAITRQQANVLARRRIRVRADRATRCGESGCRAPTASERAARLDAGLAIARTAGPAALRSFARRHSLSLAPAEVIALLVAEARGELGASLVDDDELRGWIGDELAESFAEPIRALPAGESAWVALRLERVQGRSSTGAAAGAGQRTLWLDRARITPGAIDWRVSASAGELAATEQALVARWRPQARPDATAVARDPDSIAPTATHWSLRVPASAGGLDELLVFARIRDAQGDRELALQLARSLAARSDAPAVAAALDAAVRALAWGRPWLALAITDAGERADFESVRAAAATAVLLAQAVCEGECAEDADELAAIERVLGEGWSVAMRPRLRELAFDRERTRARVGSCPSLAEALAPAAATPLADALELARRNPAAPGLARAFARAIEADPVLTCSGAVVLPALLHRRDALTGSRLAELLAHGPELRASSALGLHAALALLAGERGRAEQLAIAAAGESEDPAARWRSHARVARALDLRDPELVAIREVVLASTGLAHRDARRELLLRGLGDGWTSWGARDTPAGREAMTRSVVDHLAELAASERWHERERIIEEIVQRPWYTRSAVASLRTSALPSELEPTHPIALLRLGVGTLPSEPAVWSDELLALQITARKLATWPDATTVFGEPTRFVRARLALARHAREWPLRRRAAIGLASVGSEAERAQGLAELFAIATPAGRRELERLVLDAPAAIEPRGDGSVGAVGMVDDPELAVRLLLALPLAPALLLPDLDPQAAELPAGREPGAPRSEVDRPAADGAPSDPRPAGGRTER